MASQPKRGPVNTYASEDHDVADPDPSPVACGCPTFTSCFECRSPEENRRIVAYRDRQNRKRFGR